MLCIYGLDDGLYICRDSNPPDINVAILQPSTAQYITNLPEDADWHVISENLLPMTIGKDEILGHLRSVMKVSPDIGGIRKLTSHDKSYCALCTSMIDDGTFNVDKASSCVRTHPAWKSGLGFMTGDVVSSDLAHVLLSIFDIRRFMRGSVKRALRMYFRLATAGELENLLTHEHDPELMKSAQFRLHSLVRSWLTAIHVFPQAIINQLPHAFLVRMMERQQKLFEESGVSRERAENLGIYRATIKALDFIRLVWLHGIGLKCFDPFKFFPEESEAFAFVDYILRI